MKNLIISLALIFAITSCKKDEILCEDMQIEMKSGSIYMLVGIYNPCTTPNSEVTTTQDKEFIKIGGKLCFVKNKGTYRTKWILESNR